MTGKNITVQQFMMFLDLPFLTSQNVFLKRKRQKDLRLLIVNDYRSGPIYACDEQLKLNADSH